MTLRIAVYGAKGFVGSAIADAVRGSRYELIEVTRDSPPPGAVDILINAACPSRRLRAEQEPAWDFEECVAKTARLFYGGGWGRFVQVSSLSARSHATAYGRHRLMAEQIVWNSGLSVRLGPMYGRGLTKGYLADLMADRPVYASPDTRYAYADVKWVGERILDLALPPRVGVVEVAGAGHITLGDLAASIGSLSEFRESEWFRPENQTVLRGGPQTRKVIAWALEHRLTSKANE
jgi:nucleoside-diphosphate-sugar epimerase